MKTVPMFIVRNPLFVFLYLPLITTYGQMTPGLSHPKSININGYVGSRYQDNKRSVCILEEHKEGVGGLVKTQFTGTLVNTVNQNGKLYVLTVAHALDFDKSSIIDEVFQVDISFNYELMNPCDRLGSDEDYTLETIKMVSRVIDHESDIALLEILEEGDKENLNDLYYGGWSLKNELPDVLIGHPMGDFKKILELIEPNLYFVRKNNPFGLSGNMTYIMSKQDVDAPSQPGNSGSGLLTREGRVVGVHMGSLPVFANDMIYREGRKLSNSWMDVSEAPLLQKYLDPEKTYVSSIPGGYGMEEKHFIKDAYFDLDVPGREKLTTPGMEQGVSQMVHLDLRDVPDIDNSLPNKLFQQGGIYRKEGNFKLTVSAYFKKDSLTPVVLYSCKTVGAGPLPGSGNFEGEHIDELKPSPEFDIDSLKRVFGDYMPIVIELENLTDAPGKVRALKMPGLGYRNAVELFKPEEFKSLYTNSDYPENRANSSIFSYLDSISVTVNKSTKGYKTSDNGGYVNLIQHKIASVRLGQKVALTFFPKVRQNTTYYSIWIDYDKDHKFDGPGEQVVRDVTGAYNEPVTTSFTIPEDLELPPGGIKTRMRIALRKGNPPPIAGVGKYDSGEVEDYTIVIANEQEAKELFTEVSEEIKGENIMVKDENICASYKQGSDKGEVDWKVFKDSQGATNTSVCDCVTVKKNEENNTYHLFFSGDKSYLDVDQDKLAIVRQIQGTDVSSHRLKITTDPKPLHLYKLKTSKEESTTLYALESADNLSVSFPYQFIPVQNFNSSTALKTNKDVVSSADHKSIIVGTVLGVSGGSAGAGGAGYLIKNRSKFLKGNKYQRLENEYNESIELKMCKQD